MACSLCSRRRDLLLEVLALRQQLTVLEGTALPSEAHYSGQGLLDDAATVLVGVEAHACHRPTGHSRWLASNRFQVVLDMALAGIKLTRAGSA